MRSLWEGWVPLTEPVVKWPTSAGVLATDEANITSVPFFLCGEDDKSMGLIKWKHQAHCIVMCAGGGGVAVVARSPNQRPHVPGVPVKITSAPHLVGVGRLALTYYAGTTLSIPNRQPIKRPGFSTLWNQAMC